MIGDLPSLREIWEDTAVYVPPRDPDAIAAAVNALLDDEARRDDLARRACKRAVQFNPARMAIGYGEVYAHMRGGAQASSSVRERQDRSSPPALGA